MLHLGFAAGLRVSELVGLQLNNATWHPTPSILVHGKARRERTLPLAKESAVALRAWLSLRGEAFVPELFLNTPSQEHDALGIRVYASKTRQDGCKILPSLLKKRISPHKLRHYLPFLTMSSDIGQVRPQSEDSGHGADAVSVSPDIVFSILQTVEEAE